MNKDDAEFALELLETAEEELDRAIQSFRRVATWVEEKGDRRLAGEIHGYTLGNLRSFHDDSDFGGHQPGSVNSLKRSLNEHAGISNDQDEEA